MADIEGLNHCGLSVPDVRVGEHFYEVLLGADHCNRIGTTTTDVRHGRGAPHTCNVLGDYLFVLFPHRRDLKSDGQARGIDGARHGFAVARERFAEIIDRARAAEIPFEGPVVHPENGPLGESIYFTDPGGNFMEVCWRRDEEQVRNPLISR